MYRLGLPRIDAVKPECQEANVNILYTRQLD